MRDSRLSVNGLSIEVTELWYPFAIVRAPCPLNYTRFALAYAVKKQELLSHIPKGIHSLYVGEVP